tara:strand:- start:283 stop:834 length:552 start_codon:yes stop_codon:yes gene_type:complete
MTEKKYPTTFSELEEQFNSIDESNTDENGYQREYSDAFPNLDPPYKGCKIIEYSLEPSFFDADLFSILKYKNNYYVPAFNDQVINGYITKELYEEWEEETAKDDHISRDWLTVDTDSLEDGAYLFSLPSFFQLVKDDKDGLGREMVLLDEQDYKVVLAGLYSLTDPILGNVGKGFLIDIFYRD